MKKGEDIVDIETLAKELHEAGREAVEKGATVAAEKFGEKTRVFLSWDEITEQAREGRRIQARYLLKKYAIFRKIETDGFAPAVPLKSGDIVRINGYDVEILASSNEAGGHQS